MTTLEKQDHVTNEHLLWCRAICSHNNARTDTRIYATFLLNVFGDIVGWHRERKRRLQTRKIIFFQAHEQQNRVDIRWQKKETQNSRHWSTPACCLLLKL